MAPAYLVLETGDVFQGEWIGTPGQAAGEVVITTTMTGYQEVVTDPAYGGKLVVFTYPLIGNNGVWPSDVGRESHLAGIVVSDYCPYPSPYGYTETLADRLGRWGIPGLTGIDTRALAAKVRKSGPVRGVVSREPHLPKSVRWPDRESLEWVRRASVKQPVAHPGEPGKPHVVVVDYGHQPSFVQTFRRYGCSVTVVPYDFSADEVIRLKPDGLVLSNGPGVPEALTFHARQLRPLWEEVPTLAVGLGHLVSSLVLGASVKRLSPGHHGGNYPVKHVPSGKVWITSQNQTHAVAKESLDLTQWDVQYVNVNDGSVEGLKHKQYPLLSVKFCPGGRPGPTEAEAIIDAFLTLVNSQRKETAYA